MRMELLYEVEDNGCAFVLDIKDDGELCWLECSENLSKLKLIFSNKWIFV